MQAVPTATGMTEQPDLCLNARVSILERQIVSVVDVLQNELMELRTYVVALERAIHGNAVTEIKEINVHNAVAEHMGPVDPA